MKSKRKLRTVSFCCLAAGFILLGTGLTMGGRPGFYINYTGIHSARENDLPQPHVQEKMKLAPFTSIEIDINYADLKILPSDGYYIEYQLDGGGPEPFLEVKDQRLQLRESPSDGQMGFNFISIGGFSREHLNYYVTLYVPSDQYFTVVKLKNGNGSMELDHIRTKYMELWNDDGDVRVENFKGGNLKVDMGNGSFKGEQIEADDVNLLNDYGDCQVGTVNVKSIEAKLGNGDFTMDQGHWASMDAVNENGTVQLDLAEPLTAYKLDLETEYGTIKVPGFPDMTTVEDGARSFKSTDQGTKQVIVKCYNGDIVINAQ